MSTKNSIMEDKTFPMRLYGKMTLESNFNEEDKNFKQRYIYKNKVKEKVEPLFLEGTDKISKRTYDKHMRYLKKAEFNLIKAENTDNGIVYKISYAEDNKNYVLIDKEVLNELVTCSNGNVLKTYLVLLYTLKDGSEQKINIKWLLKKIGLSEKSKATMQIILKHLSERYNLINYRYEKVTSTEVQEDGRERASIKTYIYLKLK